MRARLFLAGVVSLSATLMALPCAADRPTAAPPATAPPPAPPAATAPPAAETARASRQEPAAAAAVGQARVPAPSLTAVTPTPPGDLAPPMASAVRCADTHGQAVCAVTYDPTAIDPALEAVPVGAPGKGGGVGRHYACYPAEPSRWNGQLLVHLVGTWGDPATASELAELACSLGFAAVAPMYENQTDARAACGADSACYEAMRREVLYGGDATAEPVRVDAANSLVRRLDGLLAHLATAEARFAGWAALRERVAGRDLSGVVLSGHSQGAGHALILARDHEVARVILLGGLTDRLRSGSPLHAPVDWVTSWRAVSKTPASRLWGLNHSDDKIVGPSQLAANYDALGVGDVACPFSEAGDYPLACRRVRMSPSGCSAVEAHLVVVQRRFGAAGGLGGGGLGAGGACQLSGQATSNAATWQFLLLAPAEPTAPSQPTG